MARVLVVERPASRYLRREYVLAAKDWSRLAAKIHVDSATPGSLKSEARNRSHNVDPDGFNTDLKEDLGFGEIGRCHFPDRSSKVGERREDASSVLLVTIDPDVQILRVPRFRVDHHRV